jgi:hypothetical protein
VVPGYGTARFVRIKCVRFGECFGGFWFSIYLSFSCLLSVSRVE